MPHIRKRKKQSKIPTQSINDKASCDIVLSFERHCVTLSGDGPSEPNSKKVQEKGPLQNNFVNLIKTFKISLTIDNVL